MTMTVDCTGLNCPLPILRLSKAMNSVGTGDQIEMIATDPGALKDVEAWAKQTGHILKESRQENERFRFLIKKK
jgi:tRNA 2-thiouridine synthesizing protein A